MKETIIIENELMNFRKIPFTIAPVNTNNTKMKDLYTENNNTD